MDKYDKRETDSQISVAKGEGFRGMGEISEGD